MTTSIAVFPPLRLALITLLTGFALAGCFGNDGYSTQKDQNPNKEKPLDTAPPTQEDTNNNQDNQTPGGDGSDTGGETDNGTGNEPGDTNDNGDDDDNTAEDPITCEAPNPNPDPTLLGNTSDPDIYNPEHFSEVSVSTDLAGTWLLNEQEEGSETSEFKAVRTVFVIRKTAEAEGYEAANCSGITNKTVDEEASITRIEPRTGYLAITPDQELVLPISAGGVTDGYIHFDGYEPSKTTYSVNNLNLRKISDSTDALGVAASQIEGTWYPATAETAGKDISCVTQAMVVTAQCNNNSSEAKISASIKLTTEKHRHELTLYKKEPDRVYLLKTSYIQLADESSLEQNDQQKTPSVISANASESVGEMSVHKLKLTIDIDGGTEENSALKAEIEVPIN
ncbi:MAG: hypothetical protein WAO12_00010 [Venatoribacter sp.]